MLDSLRPVLPDRFLPLLDRLYTVLARWRPVILAAVVLRRTATELIGHRLARGGLDPERNGETWLIGELGSRCEIFIDVGANVGAWSASMLKAAPHARGIAYEPSPVSLARLRERFSEDQRLQVVPAAVSDIAGEAQFYVEAGAGETSSLAAWHGDLSIAPEKVPVVTIDEELDRLGVGHVSLLKIDAEGFDLHVLRGARTALREGRIAAVQFEYNVPWAAAGGTLTAAAALLRECGLALFVLRQGELRTVNPSALGELFTYANFVALSPAETVRLRTFVGPDALA